MKSISWPTALAFVATLACVTILSLKGLQVPAAVTGVLGALLTAIQPALMGKGGDQ